jgi:hypothetical protein
MREVPGVFLSDPDGPVVTGMVVSLYDTLTPFAKWILGLGFWLRILYIVQVFTLLAIFVEKLKILYIVSIPILGLVSLYTLQVRLLFAAAALEVGMGAGGLYCLGVQMTSGARESGACIWFLEVEDDTEKPYIAASYGTVAVGAILAFIIGIHFARLVNKALSMEERNSFRRLM